MPPTKGFYHHGQEGYTLLLASISSTPHLPGVGVLEGMPSSGGCPHHRSHLARVHHSHVHCSVLPSNPVGEQHISRATVFPRDEESDLPDRSKARCHRGVVEVVPQVVVARDTLSTRATAHGMVAQGITEAVAGFLDSAIFACFPLGILFGVGIKSI